MAWTRLVLLFVLSAALHGRSHAVAQFRSRLLTVTDRGVETNVPMQFVPNTATIHPSSDELIDVMAFVLVHYPQIELLRISIQAERPQLARHRAAAVVRALVKRGIPAERLRILGSGAPAGQSGQPSNGTFLLHIKHIKPTKFRDCHERGRTYRHGEGWTCPDGCNACWCHDGLISSTLMGCG